MGAEESGRERARDVLAGELGDLAVLCEAAEEVRALHRFCIPGASSPGVVGELSFTILSFGLRGTLPDMGRLGGCL